MTLVNSKGVSLVGVLVLSTILISSVTLVSSMYIFAMRQQAHLDISHHANKILTRGLDYLQSHFDFYQTLSLCQNRNAFDLEMSGKECFEQALPIPTFEYEALRNGQGTSWQGSPIWKERFCMSLSKCKVKALGYLLEGNIAVYSRQDPARAEFNSYQAVFRKTR